MAENSFPFVDKRTTDAEFSALFAPVFPDAVRTVPGGPDLKVAAPGDGLAVVIAPGAATVRGHYYSLDEELRLDIAPNSGSTARIDLVVLHLEYGEVSAISARVVQGSPGAGVPAVETSVDGVQQMVLAQVTVAASAVTLAASAVADRRKWWQIETLRSLGVIAQAAQPATGVLWIETD